MLCERQQVHTGVSYAIGTKSWTQRNKSSKSFVKPVSLWPQGKTEANTEETSRISWSTKWLLHEASEELVALSRTSPRTNKQKTEAIAKHPASHLCTQRWETNLLCTILHYNSMKPDLHKLFLNSFERGEESTKLFRASINYFQSTDHISGQCLADNLLW